MQSGWSRLRWSSGFRVSPGSRSAPWGGSPGALPAHGDRHTPNAAGRGMQQIKLEKIGRLHPAPIG